MNAHSQERQNQKQNLLRKEKQKLKIYLDTTSRLIEAPAGPWRARKRSFCMRFSEVQVAAYQYVAAQETLRGAVVIQRAQRLKFMRNNSKLKEHRTLSLEEQQNEARHEATGKIKRYLDLAEKLFQNDDDSDCSPAAPVFSHHAHR